MCSCGSGSEPRGHGMGKRETADGNPRTQLATCKLEEEWSELLDHDDRCGSDDQPARLIYVWKVEYWIEKEETWLIVKIALLATTGYKERRGKTRKQRRTDV